MFAHQLRKMIGLFKRFLQILLYIKKELGNMATSMFKENAWVKAHCL